MKKIWGMIGICLSAMMLFSGCIFHNVDIVFNNSSGDWEKTEENLDLENALSDVCKVNFEGKYSKKSTAVTCTFETADVYQYILENSEELMKMDEKKLYDSILDYAKDENSPRRTVTVELPAHFEEGKLVVETDSFEYQDAVTGGVNRALSELYAQILQEELSEK